MLFVKPLAEEDDLNLFLDNPAINSYLVPVHGCENLFEFKEDENCNRRNIWNISRIKI